MKSTSLLIATLTLTLLAAVGCTSAYDTSDEGSAAGDGALRGSDLDAMPNSHGDAVIDQSPDRDAHARPDVARTLDCGVIETDDLSSNRHDGIEAGKLQVTIFYDGVSNAEQSPVLSLELVEPETGNTGFVQIGEKSDEYGRINKFDVALDTRQIDIGGCQLTGRVHIGGVTADGVIDGLAFGLYGKYDDGSYVLLKSKSPVVTTRANYVAGWPLGLNDNTFLERTPQLTDGHGRQAARMMIYGAQLMEGGMYTFNVR